MRIRDIFRRKRKPTPIKANTAPVRMSIAGTPTYRQDGSTMVTDPVSLLIYNNTTNDVAPQQHHCDHGHHSGYSFPDNTGSSGTSCDSNVSFD